jgi:hypothetical protein
VVAICSEKIGGSATRLAAELRRSQTLERGASQSSSDVGYNDQFQNVDPGQVNLIFLDLAHGVRGAEIPLLAHNLLKRAPAVPRPSQNKVLRTLYLGFFENERDASKALRLVED